MLAGLNEELRAVRAELGSSQEKVCKREKEITFLQDQLDGANRKVGDLLHEVEDATDLLLKARSEASQHVDAIALLTRRAMEIEVQAQKLHKPDEVPSHQGNPDKENKPALLLDALPGVVGEATSGIVPCCSVPALPANATASSPSPSHLTLAAGYGATGRLVTSPPNASPIRPSVMPGMHDSPPHGCLSVVEPTLPSQPQGNRADAPEGLLVAGVSSPLPEMQAGKPSAMGAPRDGTESSGGTASARAMQHTNNAAPERTFLRILASKRPAPVPAQPGPSGLPPPEAPVNPQCVLALPSAQQKLASRDLAAVLGGPGAGLELVRSGSQNGPHGSQAEAHAQLMCNQGPKSHVEGTPVTGKNPGRQGQMISGTGQSIISANDNCDTADTVAELELSPLCSPKPRCQNTIAALRSSGQLSYESCGQMAPPSKQNAGVSHPEHLEGQKLPPSDGDSCGKEQETHAGSAADVCQSPKVGSKAGPSPCASAHAHVLQVTGTAHPGIGTTGFTGSAKLQEGPKEGPGNAEGYPQTPANPGTGNLGGVGAQCPETGMALGPQSPACLNASAELEVDEETAFQSKHAQAASQPQPAASDMVRTVDALPSAETPSAAARGALGAAHKGPADTPSPFPETLQVSAGSSVKAITAAPRFSRLLSNVSSRISHRSALGRLAAPAGKPGADDGSDLLHDPFAIITEGFDCLPPIPKQAGELSSAAVGAKVEESRDCLPPGPGSTQVVPDTPNPQGSQGAATRTAVGDVATVQTAEEAPPQVPQRKRSLFACLDMPETDEDEDGDLVDMTGGKEATGCLGPGAKKAKLT